MNNPFAAPATVAPSSTSSNPFGGASNPFGSAIPSSSPSPFGDATSSSSSNPFGAATLVKPFPSLSSNGPAPAFGQPSQQSSSAPSPFGQPAQQSNRASSPFSHPDQQLKSTTSPFGQSVPAPSSATPSLAAPANTFQKRKNTFEDLADPERTGTTFATNPFQKTQTSYATPAPVTTVNSFRSNGIVKNMSNGPVDTQSKKAVQARAVAARKKPPSLYAQEIHDQLRKDRLKPPVWPNNPGDPKNYAAVDEYRVKYKAYESKVRASLIKAGLIDDPEVRKALKDAIDFRGICEDMCPEGEKVSRIVEHDVKLPEKFRNTDPTREDWANPDLMIKSFKRSAAGVDSPLPTEVRSPATLRRTVNYLIDDLLQGDENLPVFHGFLWDRTRAIRKDFIFQNAMTPQERIDQIYCLENITRFHAAALHLLSKDGNSAFSEQQEREQLGKTLLSLMQVYDECKDMDITIEHEAEFRAYFLLFNAHDPFVLQQMQDWNNKFWSQSAEIQTAVSLVYAMQNIWNYRGPLKRCPVFNGSPSFSNYFSIVEQPGVSYTMACVAEIHFTEIRRLSLKALHKAYARVRAGPKDLTAKVLNDIFRFDTEEECIEYLKDYDMEFSTEGATEPYMVVVRRRAIPHKTVKQSSSQTMVERKRGKHSFPDVVHNTVFENIVFPSAVVQVDKVASPNSLFVTQPNTSMAGEHKVGSTDVNFTDDDSLSSTPVPTKQSIAPPPTALSNGFMFTPKDTLAAPAQNPFFSQISNATTASPPASEGPADAAQPANSFFATNSASSMLQATTTPQQPKPAAPTFSWATPSSKMPATTNETPMGVFDFLNKPADQKQASVFFPTSVPESTTTETQFPTSTPVGSQDKSAKLTSDWPATTISNEVKGSQDAPASSVTAFIPATPTTTAAPFSFVPATPAPMPPTSSSLGISNPVGPAGMPTGSFDPAPGVMTSSLPPVKTPAPTRDLMTDFTKWILFGDYGIMEQLEERILEDLVRETFEKYQKEERERRQRVEDEKALAEALAFRTYSLGLKYLRLWKYNARRKVVRHAAKKNSLKIREWREEKRAEAKAERIRIEKEERTRQKRSTGPTSWLEELDKERSMKRLRRESMSLDTSRRSSPVSDAAALLATGIFDGLPNKHQMAANAVRDDDSLYDALVGVQISPNSSRPVMGPPAKPVRDPLKSVRDAGISKQEPARKWSKKAQALKDLLNGGAKKKDDDLLSFRSSASSRLGRSVGSVPGAKVTNFTRYQSNSPRSSADLDRPRKGSSSGIKSPYWLLRSQGLYTTPKGHVLSDRAPPPQILDNASQFSGDLDHGNYDDRVLEQDSAYRASLGLTAGQSVPASRRSTFSHGEAGSPPRSGFMKPKPKPSSLRQSLPAGATAVSLLDSRSQRNEADAASQADSAATTMPQDVEETLRELRKVAAVLDEDTAWFRQQNGRMSQDQHDGD